jgi:site-specific DNA-methyltransferase (adenine-specific)
MSRFLKLNTIHHGDSIDLLGNLEPRSIDMIFADPPYNISGKPLVLKGNLTGGDWAKVNEKWDIYSSDDYQVFTNDWVARGLNSLKENGAIYVCCSQHNIEAVMHALRINSCKVNNIIVWEKSNPMPNTTKRLLTHSVEFVVWAVKGKGWIFNSSDLRDLNPDRQKDGSPRMMRDVWVFPVVQGSERLRIGNGRALHPTQKPLELVRRTIIASTKKGEVVLDPFMGSGTTAVAAKIEGRKWIGIEREKRYIRAAETRIKETKVKKK